MIRLVVHGAAGRMGRRVSALVSGDDRFELIGTIDRPESSAQVGRAVESVGGAADAVIDFSSDQGARFAAEIARDLGASLLVGTTGLSRQTLDAIEVSARSVPVMIAPNTSLGVAVMNHLVEAAARLLDDQYQIDVIEQHHRFKRDAPSGTAAALLQSIEAARGAPVPHERVHCIRSGDIIGDHEVQFAGRRERLKISHSAGDRDVFAAGALAAAAWLYRQPPGQYTIGQALGLGAAR